MAQHNGWDRGGVHGYTIRRIEGQPEKHLPGRVPSIRVAFVVAHYFGMRPHEIWKPMRRVKVAA